MSRIKECWFPVLLTLILFVSLYDTLLIVAFQGVIRSLEENPVGIWLLDMTPGDIGLFVRVKLAGTLCVACVLVALHRSKSRKTLPVTGSIAAYQAGLFSYLTFS